MAKITIKEFALKHNVTRQAIEAAISSGALKSEKRFGITVISESAAYDPVRGRGRNKVKAKRVKK